MRILGIESSCDETAVSIIEVGGTKNAPHIRVLANVVFSQVKLHAKFGGVVPNLAKREHQKNFVPVLLAALRESGIVKRESRIKQNVSNTHDSRFKILTSILEREQELFPRMVAKVVPLKVPAIDAIAVTIGPGLAPALWVGVNFARALSFLWGKAIIPVNHLEGHIVTNLLKQVSERVESREERAGRRGSIPYSLSSILFPALCLIVSGGHTELVLMRRYGEYRILGETLDDAAGEAFDKVAKMMKLGFPGGPIISRLAEFGDAKRFLFPRPMMHAPNFDFSFSGLKTSVLYMLRDLKKLDVKTKRDIAASFQSAVVDVLVAKTVRAAKRYQVKMVMIGGGVAANKKLRHDLGTVLHKQFSNTKYLLPNTKLTGDNALMIALAGYFNQKKKKAWRSLQARPNLRLDQR